MNTDYARDAKLSKNHCITPRFMPIYQVFHDLPLSQGNFVTITGIAGATVAPVPGYSIAVQTCCQVQHRRDNRYRVDCYQGAHKIQCCGHGLLAAAHALFALGKQARLVFGSNLWAECLPGDEGPAAVWLHLPRVASAAVPIPDWSLHLLTSAAGRRIDPERAAATAKADGYLLLQLDARADLPRLAVDHAVIAANTRQAVLLWQHDAAQPGQVNVRYFAPQYGNIEDAATGSVLRVLGPYLQQVAKLDSFVVRQCSSSGGRMTARNRTASVAISGNVQSVASEELRAQ